MIHDIYIIDEKLDLVNKLNEMFSEKKDYSIKRLNVIDLKIALKNIPALIIINEDTINCNVSQICKEIHEDDNNKITPIINKYELSTVSKILTLTETATDRIRASWSINSYELSL